MDAPCPSVETTGSFESLSTVFLCIMIVYLEREKSFPAIISLMEFLPSFGGAPPEIQSSPTSTPMWSAMAAKKRHLHSDPSLGGLPSKKLVLHDLRRSAVDVAFLIQTWPSMAKFDKPALKTH